MAKEITFAIYIQQGGRWLLEARYNKNQKDQAIEEARQIEKQTKLESIKVVREIYDENDNLIKEQIVYQGKGKENAAVGGPSGGGGGGGGGRGSGGGGSSSPSRPSAGPSRGAGPNPSAGPNSTAAHARPARAPASAGGRRWSSISCS